MDDTMNTATETAISQETETQQVNTEVEEPDAQPKAQETDNGITAQPPEEISPAAQTPENFLEIKYFGECVGLTKEEAKNYAEIGRRYSDVRDKLERFATLKGKTVDEFISGLEAAEDAEYRQSLIDRFGNDEEMINQMMELYEMKKQKTVDSAKESRRQAEAAAEQSTNERIAAEFTAMQKDFPELTDFASLPSSVKKAANDGMPLAYAYLLYQHSENKNIAAAKAQAEAAAKKSTGSMNSGEVDSQTAEEKGYLSGLWNR